MKKTPQPAPANTSGGNNKKKLRPVYLTDEVWEALKATGNATHTINRLLMEAGYGVKKTTT
jgi:hypothetical protein